VTIVQTSQKARPFSSESVKPPHRSEPWVAVVANPYSGAGQNRQLVANLVDALAKRGLESRVLWDPIERATVLGDPDWAGTCRCIIAAGGDGTVADVVNDTRDIPIAMLPIGNENLFARQYQFRKIDRLVRAVERGRTVEADLGKAGDRLFTLMVSAGLDADVVHRVQKWRVRSEELRRVTRLSYVRPTMSAVFGYRYPKLTLEADGQTFHGSHVMIFNMNQYACRLQFTPEAEPDDGLLHFVVFEHPGAISMCGYLLSVLLRRHAHTESVQCGAAKFLQISSPQPVPVQVDGDPSGATPLEISIVPQAIRVIDMRE
jgi:diacylglycerol kinase (ATP)